MVADLLTRVPYLVAAPFGPATGTPPPARTRGPLSGGTTACTTGNPRGQVRITGWLPGARRCSSPDRVLAARRTSLTGRRDGLNVDWDRSSWVRDPLFYGYFRRTFNRQVLLWVSTTPVPPCPTRVASAGTSWSGPAVLRPS